MLEGIFPLKEGFSSTTCKSILILSFKILLASMKLHHPKQKVRSIIHMHPHTHTQDMLKNPQTWGSSKAVFDTPL